MADDLDLNNTLVGTEGEDIIDAGAGDDHATGKAGHDRIEGELDNDTIEGGDDNDLAVGDNVGSEWSLVDGKWVYDASKQTGFGDGPSYDDVVYGGAGDDVVIGNGGQDLLYGGTGDDLINAGSGKDIAYGGDGRDIINLDKGDDLAYGGMGADIINGGEGNDVMYGDLGQTSILAEGKSHSSSFDQHSENGAWDTTSHDDGSKSMSQSIATSEGETYKLKFDLAANTGAGSHEGCVEVIWNGEVIATIDASAGLKEYNLEVEGTGEDVVLTFKSLPVETEYSGPEIHDGPIDYYDATTTIGGESVDVAAFAPGQASLYQVISGQLKVFDTAANEYQDVGDNTGLKLNAIGFNTEDDLIYGVAKKAGTDSLGNPVEVTDIVMLDAQGNAYRVGDGPTGDYVGDFDDSGNLWTFNSSMDRITRVDVDNRDADGNPEVTNFDIPDNLFSGRMYDIAFNPKENAFYAVEAPSSNGGDGKLHKIDLNPLDEGGAPQIDTIPISGTLFEDGMKDGMVKGAYGAVFMDGEGNIYAGLNRGDHDLDGSTGSQGSIYRINYDFEQGTAHAEFMSESQSTGSNDGAADPRSIDPFAEVDLASDIVMTSPVLVPDSGGDDDLRGGVGDDVAYGGAGDDLIHGGQGDDKAEGGSGNDKIFGGDGNDVVDGGTGNDKLFGGDGKDHLSGGEGDDLLIAGRGDDNLSGGSGADRLVGGSGSDTIEGGAGNDHMWGGNWWKDGASDTFVVSAGGGKDMIHDFEVGTDKIDLSSYGLEFADLQNLISDKGWATEIDLSAIDGGESGDKIILKSVDAEDLDESNFLL